MTVWTAPPPPRQQATGVKPVALPPRAVNVGGWNNIVPFVRAAAFVPHPAIRLAGRVLGLILTVAQLWGWLNQQKRKASQVWPIAQGAEYSYPTRGTLNITMRTRVKDASKQCKPFELPWMNDTFTTVTGGRGGGTNCDGFRIEQQRNEVEQSCGDSWPAVSTELFIWLRRNGVWERSNAVIGLRYGARDGTQSYAYKGAAFWEITDVTFNGTSKLPTGVAFDYLPNDNKITPAPLPGVAPPVWPLLLPVQVPQTPDGDPVEEGSGGTAKPVVPSLAPPGMLPGWSIAGRPVQDGALVPLPKPAVITTPEGSIFPWPGSPPLVDNGPRPDLVTIAKEMGKLEQKLEWLLRPPALPGDDLTDRLGLLMDLVRQLWNASTDGAPEGEYELTTPCDTDDQGRPVMRTVHWPQTDDNQSALLARMDALAALLQAHKDLKQPVCAGHKPDLAGEWVTVNFQSDDPSPSGEKRLRKLFRYRDQSAASQEDHIAHWRDFAWDAGPVMVVSKGLPWGVPKVWAASIAEGKRVIAHAAQIAGVDLTDPKHEWVISGSSDPRYGQPGRMRVDSRGGRFLRITKRPGPDGLPTGASPDS